MLKVNAIVFVDGAFDFSVVLLHSNAVYNSVRTQILLMRRSRTTLAMFLNKNQSVNKSTRKHQEDQGYTSLSSYRISKLLRFLSRTVFEHFGRSNKFLRSQFVHKRRLWKTSMRKLLSVVVVVVLCFAKFRCIVVCETILFQVVCGELPQNQVIVQSYAKLFLLAFFLQLNSNQNHLSQRIIFHQRKLITHFRVFENATIDSLYISDQEFSSEYNFVPLDSTYMVNAFHLTTVTILK